MKKEYDQSLNSTFERLNLRHETTIDASKLHCTKSSIIPLTQDIDGPKEKLRLHESDKGIENLRTRISTTPMCNVHRQMDSSYLMPRSICSWIPNPKHPVSLKFLLRSSYSFTFRPLSSSCIAFSPLTVT